MKWTDTSSATPGFRSYEANDENHAGHHYLIQRKIDGTGLWRMFFKETETDANRVIYVGDSLKECQDYAETWSWST